MSTSAKAFLLGMLLLASLSAGGVRADEPTPTPSTPRFTAADVIEVVNSLRISNGLPALAVHPVLMQVAAAEASGIAGGYGGHWRPENMTLGQWLLSLGYPLSGDLSMDGYRAENWFVASTSDDLSAVTAFWQGDAEHRDTMFSPNRSDIGAAVAVGEDGQVYVVLETALQTSSGKMQYDAYSILTGIPQTQVAYADMATLAAKNGLLPQYSMPVTLNTPWPDGNIYHEVEYGQSLWSIAMAYHTTIKDIQRLNNLPDITIYVGQKLLVMQGARQPVPTSKLTATLAAQRVVLTPSPAGARSPTPQPTRTHPVSDDRTTRLSIAAIVLAGLVLAGVFIAMMRKKGASEK